jgi:ribonucleoside-triphosphate reductase
MPGLVIKRNKKAQKYNQNKIITTLRKTFKVTNKDLPDWLLEDILNDLKITDGITTSEIQTQLEDELMDKGYKDQARYLIIYRHINHHEKSMASKVRFMREYLSATNAATGSKFDANSNVTEKNVATLNSELFKGDTIKLNRYRLYHKIEEMYGKELADEYIYMLEKHFLYKHDESSIYPYCVSITLYPYLLSGLKDLGGLSATPKNLDSFCGTFVNLIFAISSQFAGAIASGEFLMYFDYFARKEWGNDYYKNSEKVAKYKYNNEEKVVITIDKQIEQYFQQIVYSLNQPAAARGFQSAFWNISYFDKYYFDGMFHDFKFPDGTAPIWNSLNWLQKKFMKWFNKERTKTLLTFPVESFALLTDGNDLKDEDAADFVAEMYSEGHSFFTYMSDNPDALASCCRLRNEITDNQFSYSLGCGGVMTGSKSVMTLNLNRLIQEAIRKNKNYVEYLREQLLKVHKFQNAFNELMKEYYNMDALPVYKAGFITLDKQYLTIGVNGFVEAAEFLGIKVGVNDEYREFCDSILKVFYDENKKARTKEIMYNTEFVPRIMWVAA